jgi:hypothetical protein
VPKSKRKSSRKNGKAERGRPLEWWKEQARVACDTAQRALDRADQAIGDVAFLEGGKRRRAHLAWWIARMAVEAMLLGDDEPGADWISDAWEARAGSVFAQALTYVETQSALLQYEPTQALDHAADLLRTIRRLELPNVGDVARVPLAVVTWLEKVTDGRALPGTFTPQGALARIAITSRTTRLTAKMVKTEAGRITRRERK